MMWYMIYLTAIRLTPGGSSTSHIYTQKIHIIQRKEKLGNTLYLLYIFIQATCFDTLKGSSSGRRSIYKSFIHSTSLLPLPFSWHVPAILSFGGLASSRYYCNCVLDNSYNFHNFTMHLVCPVWFVMFPICSHSGQSLGTRDGRRLGQVLHERPVGLQTRARLQAAKGKHVLVGAHEGPGLQMSESED
jgi:hypothetical protein